MRHRFVYAIEEERKGDIDLCDRRREEIEICVRGNKRQG